MGASMSAQASPVVVGECLAMVAPAEAAFHSRWRMSTLERCDSDLHQLLREQIDLYSTALIIGSAEELREQAGAMVRGWRAACGAMEAKPHDAYLVGLDWATKTRVVISDHKHSIAHLSGHEECRVVAVSPDEVAKLIGSLGIIALTKEHFPDAELVSFGQPNPILNRDEGGGE
jgi:hypothetical protein